MDVWDFERDENPDGGAIDSNPVDVLADGKRLIVADAGGNTLLKARKSGRVELLSLFGDRLVPSPFGGEMPMQGVPTGVVEGPDGDYFMSQLTGFQFPVGAANVYRVDRKSGEADVFASGFTNIMDLAFGEDGAKQQVALPPDTLTEPGGITVGEQGSLYVTNKSTSPGEGEVLRIDVAADEDEADEEQDEDEDADDD